MDNKNLEEFNINVQLGLFQEAAHESKNAIAACMGFIELMLHTKTFNSHYLTTALSELKRAVSILDDYSKARLPCDPKSQCDLNSCVDKVCTILTPKCRLRSIELIALNNPVPQVRGESGKINQALINLVENAINAIEKNGRIVIETQLKDNYVLLSVSDTGSGIDDSIKEKIFDPFFTTRPEGTGLGLYVCKKIIESYGGSITLEKSTRGSTSFVIKLPVIK